MKFKCFILAEGLKVPGSAVPASCLPRFHPSPLNMQFIKPAPVNVGISAKYDYKGWTCKISIQTRYESPDIRVPLAFYYFYSGKNNIRSLD